MKKILLGTKEQYGDRITPEQGKAIDEFYERMAHIFAEQAIWMMDEEARKLREAVVSDPNMRDPGEGL